MIIDFICQRLDHADKHTEKREDDEKTDEEILQDVLKPHVSTHATDEETKPDPCDDKEEEVEILSVNNDLELSGQSDFLGAGTNSGAQQNVIGKRQEDAYSELSGNRKQADPTQSSTKYRFGEKSYDGIGILKIRIPK